MSAILLALAVGLMALGLLAIAAGAAGALVMFAIELIGGRAHG